MGDSGPWLARVDWVLPQSPCQSGSGVPEQGMVPGRFYRRLLGLDWALASVPPPAVAISVRRRQALGVGGPGCADGLAVAVRLASGLVSGEAVWHVVRQRGRLGSSRGSGKGSPLALGLAPRWWQ